jgi:hypothetical protein
MTEKQSEATSATLEDAKQALDDEYNRYISVYDNGDFLRFTNGSAGMYIDIRLKDGVFQLTGERYQEQINKRCQADTDALLATLKSTV